MRSVLKKIRAVNVSSTLRWSVISEGEKLSNDLKSVLEQYCRLPWSIDEGDKKYFVGLKDAGVHGAQKVIDLLEEHGEIRLRLSY